MSKKAYFFCYDPTVNNRLHRELGIKYVTRAIHPETGRMFWLYERNEEFSAAIDAIGR
ncbi:hypothetical protein D3C86_1172050 [compost metagenome]